MDAKRHPIAARLAQAVRAARKAHGMTQAALAERLDVTPQMVSFIECGRLQSIDFETLGILEVLAGNRCLICGEERDPAVRKFHRAVRQAARSRESDPT